MRAEGIVQYVNHRDTRAGVTWNIRLEGDEKYYGTYTAKPTCLVGDYITFDYKTSGAGYDNVDKGTIVVVEDKGGTTTSEGAAPSQEEAAPVQQRAAAAKKASGNKDKVIQMQSCRNSALAMFAILAAADKLPVGAKDPLGALQVLVDQQTQEFWEVNTLVDATGVSPLADDTTAGE